VVLEWWAKWMGFAAAGALRALSWGVAAAHGPLCVVMARTAAVSRPPPAVEEED
jgi:hypothetical protein